MPSARYPQIDESFWRQLLALCDEAGTCICEHYHEPALAGKLRAKDDDSPLTRADLAAHRILADGLARIAPELPLLSEESDAAAIADRRNWPAFWMVDPLDGTKEFLDRTGEFTINIALIVEDRPLAGLIYQPLNRCAYAGAVGAGAHCYERQGPAWSQRELATATLGASQLVLLASRRHRNPRLQSTLDFLGSRYSLERRDSGSALKFCELAAGRGDCYPRFSPCSEWDVAAGDALVTAAGGAVLGLDGEVLRYNSRDTLLSPPFLAIGDPQAGVWRELLGTLDSAADAQLS